MNINKFLYLILFFIAFTIASCDKQEDWNDVSREGAESGVGFGSPFAEAMAIFGLPDAGTVDQTINVFASGATGGLVTITVDPSVITEYNSINGTEIPEAPAGFYTVPSSITIPSGSYAGTDSASVDVTGLANEGGVSYAIGLRLSSDKYVLPGHEKMVIIVTIQNPYDADYDVEGYLVHPSSPRAIADSKHLTTIDAQTVEAGLGDLYTSDYYFSFQVDEANKLVNWEPLGATPAKPSSGFMTVDNPTGNSTYPGGEYTSEIYNNMYYPDTQVFMMHYGYGTGSTGQNGYSREVFEKWTRQ